jgi:hypothetical protein
VNAEQVAIVALVIAVALAALVSAGIAWRRLGRTAGALRATQTRLDGRHILLSTQLIEVRSQLDAVDAVTERVLWQLAAADERMDRATAGLVASGAASDTLRVRLIEGRLTIARLRQLVRLAMRLGELRRVIL